MIPAAANGEPGIHRRLWPAALAAAVPLAAILIAGANTAAVYLIGSALGLTLYHGSLGFSGAYRRLFRRRELDGVAAQMVMIVLASLLFAPMLAEGGAFGQTASGAVAPLGLGVAFGAFIFGIGMQLGGGCGSGTLFAAGGGDVRLLVTLVFFCAGGFWASLDLDWWENLPIHPPVSLGRELGFGPAVAAQAAVLLLLYLMLRRAGCSMERARWWPQGGGLAWLPCGPWPMLLATAMLALLNLATLAVAGHPWTITWGFTLWAAKVAEGFGWDPAGSSFWSGGFPAQALSAPVLSDTTSAMNLGIVAGALAAAILAGRFRFRWPGGPRPLAAAMLGGLMLGYGARLAYGCNIGALFSGAASTSLHAWLWLLAALPGNWLGMRLRPLLHLDPPVSRL